MKRNEEISQTSAKTLSLLLILCILFFSTLGVFILGELVLRYCIFSKGCNAPLIKQTTYYANSLVEDQYFTSLFRNLEPPGIVDAGLPPQQNYFPVSTSRDFNQNRTVSIESDPILGFRRKAGVRVPCHETSNFGTRATHDYPLTGHKILFFGDSFVESHSCSDSTLTAKLEKKSGVDTLNYGVGGYGFDQTYLLFDKTFREFAPDETIILLGLIPDDLRRMLQPIYFAPKPYFTVTDGPNLVLHTEHLDPIHPLENWKSFVARYKPPHRSYLFQLTKAKLGFLPKRERFDSAKDQQQMQNLFRMLLENIKKRVDQFHLKLLLVNFVQPEVYPSNQPPDFFPEEFRNVGLPFVDLNKCRGYNTRDPTMWTYAHPNEALNELIADCILIELRIQFPEFFKGAD